MSVKRVLKQAAYAIGFVAVCGGILLGLASIISGPSPVALMPTPTPNFEPVQVERVSVIAHDGLVDAVARLSNPNQRLGAGSYPVVFIARDGTGAEVSRQTIQSYVLPGSVQYVAALSMDAPRPVSAVDVELPTQPQFTELPPRIALPQLSTFLRQRTERQIGSTAYHVQQGVVTNSSTFDFNTVEVTAVAFDANDTVVGVGTTFVGRLSVGEQREFTVQWPLPQAAVQRVVTLASTNIFREDNIVRELGNSGSLR